MWDLALFWWKSCIYWVILNFLLELDKEHTEGWRATHVLDSSWSSEGQTLEYDVFSRWWKTLSQVMHNSKAVVAFGVMYFLCIRLFPQSKDTCWSLLMCMALKELNNMGVDEQPWWLCLMASQHGHHPAQSAQMDKTLFCCRIHDCFMLCFLKGENFQNWTFSTHSKTPPVWKSSGKWILLKLTFGCLLFKMPVFCTFKILVRWFRPSPQ